MPVESQNSTPDMSITIRVVVPAVRHLTHLRAGVASPVVVKGWRAPDVITLVADAGRQGRASKRGEHDGSISLAAEAG